MRTTNPCGTGTGRSAPSGNARRRRREEDARDQCGGRARRGMSWAHLPLPPPATPMACAATKVSLAPKRATARPGMRARPRGSATTKASRVTRLGTVPSPAPGLPLAPGPRGSGEYLMAPSRCAVAPTVRVRRRCGDALSASGFAGRCRRRGLAGSPPRPLERSEVGRRTGPAVATVRAYPPVARARRARAQGGSGHALARPYRDGRPRSPTRRRILAWGRPLDRSPQRTGGPCLKLTSELPIVSSSGPPSCCSVRRQEERLDVPIHVRVARRRQR